MKRGDIQIGVEYARHGAMAYGRIPNRTPDQVRFTSLDPNCRRVVRLRVVSAGSRVERVSARLTKDYHGIATNIRAATAGAQPGDEVEYLEPPEPGALPGEVYHYGTWKPTLIRPATVHMTWEEHLAAEIREAEERTDRDIRMAPMRIESAIRTIRENATLIGMSKAEVYARIYEIPDSLWT